MPNYKYIHIVLIFEIWEEKNYLIFIASNHGFWSIVENILKRLHKFWWKIKYIFIDGYDLWLILLVAIFSIL